MNKKTIYTLYSEFTLLPGVGKALDFNIIQNNNNCKVVSASLEYNVYDSVLNKLIQPEFNDVIDTSLRLGNSLSTPISSPFEITTIDPAITSNTGQGLYIFNAKQIKFDNLIFSNLLDCRLWAANLDPVATMVFYATVIIEIEIL